MSIQNIGSIAFTAEGNFYNFVQHASHKELVDAAQRLRGELKQMTRSGAVRTNKTEIISDRLQHLDREIGRLGTKLKQILSAQAA